MPHTSFPASLAQKPPRDEFLFCRLYMELTGASESEARDVFMFVSDGPSFNDLPQE